ncbi:MAG: hypothetical protein JNJ45_08800 [Chthonomonas sp.]|nr:hypothetical protein [Chthonomonas sp.]
MVKIEMLKKSWILLLATAAILPATAVAQSDQGKKSDEILVKMRQVDMLSQILPAVFTSEQLKKILPVIERCRKTVRETEAKEATVLAALEASLDRSISDALNKKQMPKPDVKNKIANTIKLLTVIRDQVAQDNAQKVYDVMAKELNTGQLRAISNALNPKRIDPKINTTGWTQERKIKYWVRVVLLDPTTYPLLVKLSR